MSRTSLFSIPLFVICGVCRGSECPGDGDDDTDVDLRDVASFQACFGLIPTEGCTLFDLATEDGIDLADFAAFKDEMVGPATTLDYGPSPYPDLEAEILAVEIGTGLLADPAPYERIHRDLALIRNAIPALASVYARAALVPNRIVVFISPFADWCPFEKLNAYYQADVTFRNHQSNGLDTYNVRFPGFMRIELVADDYAALEGVAGAYVSGFVGDGDDIEVYPGDKFWTYVFDQGWGDDCFAGCKCHRYWTIVVDEVGRVTLIETKCNHDYCC